MAIGSTAVAGCVGADIASTIARKASDGRRLWRHNTVGRRRNDLVDLTNPCRLTDERSDRFACLPPHAHGFRSLADDPRLDQRRFEDRIPLSQFEYRDFGRPHGLAGGPDAVAGAHALEQSGLLNQIEAIAGG